MRTKFFFPLLVLVGLAAGLISCSSAKLGGSLASYRDYSPNRTTESPRLESKPKDESRANTQVTKRMFVYKGDLGVQINNIDETQKQIHSITKSLGGYIEEEKVTRDGEYSYYTIRVPQKNFELAMVKFGELGQIYKKEIAAEDITEKYQDIVMRIELDQKTLNHLKALLPKITDIKERIKILKEINRLRTQIDKMTKIRDFYAHQEDYSTIYLTLKSNSEKPTELYTSSPFSWIASISPTQRTVYKMSQAFFPQPKNFLTHYEKFKKGESVYLYGSADGVIIRMGEIENYPLADMEFWSKALATDMRRRNYKPVLTKKYPIEKIKSGEQAERIQYEFIDRWKKMYYDLTLAVVDDKIYLIEIFFPDAQARDKHENAIENSFQQLSFN